MKRILSLLLAAVLIFTFTGCGLLIPKETEAPTEPTEAEIPLETKADQRAGLGKEVNVSTALAEDDPAAQVLAQAAKVFEAQTGCTVNFTWQTSDLEAGEKVPFIPSLLGVYYNRTVFEECGITALPETWEEFLQLCETLKAAGFQPISINSQDAATALEVLLLPLLGRLDSVEIWEENQLAVDALQKMADLAADGYLIMADAPAGQDKLARSNAAMTIGTLEDCQAIGERNLMDIDWGVIPMFGGFVSWEYLSVSGELAADFAALVTTGEFDQLRADVTGGIPADVANEDVLPGSIGALQKAMTRGAKPTEEFQTLCLDLWTGKYAEGLQLAAMLDKLGEN